MFIPSLQIFCQNVSCIQADEILETDKEFSDKLNELIPGIAPDKVGWHG